MNLGPRLRKGTSLVALSALALELSCSSARSQDRPPDAAPRPATGTAQPGGAGPFAPGQPVPDQIQITPPAPADRPRPNQPDPHYQEVEPPPRTAPTRAPGKDGIVRFPSLRVDVARKIVELDGRVCLQRGLIEVFACTPYGKKHEAVLELDCRPEHVMAGCLLLGMQEERGQIHALGGGGELKGERAIVTVSWRGEDGAEVTRRAEDLLLDAHDGTTMERVGWTFTGSRFVKVAGRQQFASNASGQIITSFHDPDAILDNPMAKGADDTTYYANSRALPAPGTPVVVRIVRASENGADARDPGALGPEHIPPVAPDPAGDGVPGGK